MYGQMDGQVDEWMMDSLEEEPISGSRSAHLMSQESMTLSWNDKHLSHYKIF